MKRSAKNRDMSLHRVSRTREATDPSGRQMKYVDEQRLQKATSSQSQISIPIPGSMVNSRTYRAKAETIFFWIISASCRTGASVARCFIRLTQKQSARQDPRRPRRHHLVDRHIHPEAPGSMVPRKTPSLRYLKSHLFVWDISSSSDSGRISKILNFGIIYPVHVITRKFFGEMTRKLSVTESRKSVQFLVTCSRRKPSVELAACGVARVVRHMLVHGAP
jgi:hypothetical protein